MYAIFLSEVVIFLFYIYGSLFGLALETSRFDKGCSTNYPPPNAPLSERGLVTLEWPGRRKWQHTELQPFRFSLFLRQKI